MSVVNLFFFFCINARATELQLERPDQNKILRRFVNCFSKEYELHESGKVRMKQKNSINANV